MPYSDQQEEYKGKYKNKFKYSLQAVVSHVGEIEVGHYITFLKY